MALGPVSMAPFHPRLPTTILFVLLVAAGAAGHTATGDCRRQARYSRIFCFGNSLTDTGNATIFPLTAGGSFTRPPYGETHFGHPSGRASDGRLVIDFLVPQPTPYLAGSTAAEFLNGTNFAVGSATALDPEFLASRGIASLVPISLSNQTIWFQDVVQLLNSSGGYVQWLPDLPCIHMHVYTVAFVQLERAGGDEITASSVFFVGEIGFNEYQYALVNHSVDVAASLLPHIVDAIHSALTTMVAAGARTVVVTGMLPIGCEPLLLAAFPDNPPGGYDPASGCITGLNELAERHNRALRRMLGELRRAHPGRSFLYADAYRPIVNAVTSPARYGFGDKPLAACCGSGGDPYNVDVTVFCGTPGSTACADPSKFVSWDGIHFTEAADRLVARAMLRGLLSRVGGPASAVHGASCGCPSARIVSLVTAE
ncbi:hypothetical protein HU200_023679 [Digitaria exilis]|uniref:GDSL esterase/lipase n=1 Tax=Digitaria exilis TaxID=1010633 RepID=A0A835EU72_9POAL|nr:hypothetical protein HU200_023679 [Digitaria exilis]